MAILFIVDFYSLLLRELAYAARLNKKRNEPITQKNDAPLQSFVGIVFI